MGSKKRHHVVSRGYQRFFADGELVQLCDKEPPEVGPRIRPAGTRGVFVVPHFNSYLFEDRLITDLEDRWGQVETAILPELRSWTTGEETPLSRDAARVLAAIHFARSYGFRRRFEEITEDIRDEQLARLVASRRVRQGWQRQFGTAPDLEAIRAIGTDALTELVDPNGRFLLERMVVHYEFVLNKLADLHVVAYAPRTTTVDFVLGDSPFVFWDQRAMRVGSRGRLALGDAQSLMLPIGRRLAVMFTTKPEPDALINPMMVQYMNHLTWRAAYSQVIAHPETDLSKSLGMRL